MRLRRLAMLGILVLVLLTANLGAAAAQPFSGWRRDAEWSEQRRHLSVVSDPRGFVVESARNEAGSDDILVGRFHLAAAEYRLELRNQSGAGHVETLQVTLKQILEFRDEDGDERYSSTDPVVRKWALADSLLPELAGQTNPDGSHTLTATYPLGDDPSQQAEGPTVELRFHLHPAPLTIGGSDVVPTETKFDLEIHSMRYNSSESRVAAEFQVQSTQPSRPDANAYGAEATEYRLGFSWKPFAAVDAQTLAVHATVVPRSDASSDVFLSYGRGERIFHDPSVGASHFEPTLVKPIVDILAKGSPSLYLVGFLGALLALGSVTYLRARRR